jgi:hypothetical protein
LADSLPEIAYGHKTTEKKGEKKLKIHRFTNILSLEQRLKEKFGSIKKNICIILS